MEGLVQPRRQDGAGGIARVKRGVDMELPLNSLVVLPLKIKACNGQETFGL